MNRRVATLVLLSILASPRGNEASQDQIPAPYQALLMLRVLTYNRAFAAADRKDATAAVLVPTGGGPDQAEASQMIEAIGVIARKTRVLGRSLKVARVAFTKDGLASLRELRPDILYVGHAFGGSVPEIARVTRAASVLTFTPSRRAVEAGLAIGLVRRPPAAALLVNLEAARAEGADLDRQLLDLAELVRR